MTIPFFCFGLVLYSNTDNYETIDGGFTHLFTDSCVNLQFTTTGNMGVVKFYTDAINHMEYGVHGTIQTWTGLDCSGYNLYAQDVGHIATATSQIFLVEADLSSRNIPLNQAQSVAFYMAIEPNLLCGGYPYNCASLGTDSEDKDSIYLVIKDTEIPASYINLNYPVNEEIIATTSVNFSANYWNIDNYEKAGFKITQQDNYFGTTYLEGNAIDGQSAYSTTTELQRGAYSYQAYLANATTTIYSADIFTFYVLENPYTYATTTIINTDFNCDDLGTIAGAFCSVLVKLFKPSPESMSRFAQLKTIIEKKPPFGYFTTIKNQYSELGATTTPAFVLQQITPITNNVFSPLKTGLAWILWLFFGFYAIKRISGYNL